MPTEYLLTLILKMFNMPADISAGILALHHNGLLSLASSAVAVFATMLCIGVKRGFLEQSGQTLAREPLTVVAGGIMWYALGMALILIFLVSIVGFPIAGLVFFVMLFFIYAGQAALCVMLGWFFADKYHKTMGIYQAGLIGAMAVEALNYIPYAGWIFRFLLWPVLALGIFSAGISNSVKKRYYPIKESPAPDRENIRGIILQRIDKR